MNGLLRLLEWSTISLPQLSSFYKIVFFLRIVSYIGYLGTFWLELEFEELYMEIFPLNESIK